MSEPLEPKAEAFRKYAWDYFALHADQRLRAFHFYIIFSTALLGGFAISVKSGGLQFWMMGFGLLLVFFSFVFWKMDERARQLVKNGENALRAIDLEHGFPDQSEFPHALRLFCREEFISGKLKLDPPMSGHFTYARCFRWVFVMFVIVGILLVVVSATRYGSTPVLNENEPRSYLLQGVCAPVMKTSMLFGFNREGLLREADLRTKARAEKLSAMRPRR